MLSLSTRDVNLFCPNPFCPRFNKAFTIRCGQTRHFINSPGCFQKKLAAAAGTAATDQAVLPPPRKRHGGIAFPIRNQLRHTNEDTDVVFRSNKRPSLLRRDVVNDNVLGARMVEAKDSGSEEECNSVVEFDYDEDEVVGAGSSMEDDDECTGDDRELAFKSKKFHVTTKKKWSVSLLQILDHINAPDYAYGSIMKWAHDASHQKV
jgi:hypothetical protein